MGERWGVGGENLPYYILYIALLIHGSSSKKRSLKSEGEDLEYTRLISAPTKEVWLCAPEVQGGRWVPAMRGRGMAGVRVGVVRALLASLAKAVF